MSNTSAAVGKGQEVPAEASHLERARELAPVFSNAAERVETERELPAQWLEAMHDRELFRLSMPGCLGGPALPPAQLAEITEVVAMSDASAAWCLGQALGCATASAYMDESYAQRVFGPRNAVLAWGAGAHGKAVAIDGGYRVSGSWQFASGSKHATWIGAHCRVFERDGSPRLTAAGTQVNRTALFPRERATIADDWYVMGLKGTRSEGYSVDGLEVEDGFTVDRNNPAQRQQDETLFRFPLSAIYASVFSGVALGIARAMLDELIALAAHKQPRGARSSMRDSAVVQTRLAELEAQLGSARAYQQQTLRDNWHKVDSSQSITLAQRLPIRLATTYAINQATDVVEQVYRLAGATAIFESQPFERRFRDAHGVSQQVQGRHTNFETVGRFMLGLDVDTLFV